jgi:RNA polymerase sigma factor (TIGR02999 family)
MPSPNELLPQVYDELRRVAAAKLSSENAGQTIQATALVHEAWLKLAQSSGEWQDRTHFLRTAATAMRQILIDRARAKRTAKRDGVNRVAFEEIQSPLPDDELIALDEALSRLALTRPDHAKLVELRYFTNLTADEAAEAIGVSPSTADRMWRIAKAWLQVELKPSDSIT